MNPGEICQKDFVFDLRVDLRPFAALKGVFFAVFRPPDPCRSQICGASFDYDELLTLPEGDLDHILTHTAGLWQEFAGASLFITGGTGFFGHWLLSSFAEANARFNLNARALVPRRGIPAAFERRSLPGLASGLCNHLPHR